MIFIQIKSSSTVRQSTFFFLKGFTVFAGFSKKNEEAEKLKEVTSGRVHIVEFDVTNEKQILAAAAYVKKNLPQKSDGE